MITVVDFTMDCIAVDTVHENAIACYRYVQKYGVWRAVCMQTGHIRNEYANRTRDSSHRQCTTE